MKPITINVTQEDIDYGLKHDPNFCPIARAIKRETKADVSVGTYTATLVPKKTLLGKILGRNSSYYFVNLSKTATAFISAFDTGKKVEPFTEVIDIERWA